MTTTQFYFVQQYEEYTDYDTYDESGKSDSIRRLTLVEREGQPRYAYLTTGDYQEQRLTWDQGVQMLADSGIEVTR